MVEAKLLQSQRLAAHGTGMGLSTVHQVISDHQGEIQVNSAPGQGTEVAVWLPRWQVK
jgi:signal transduction histidine kinase